jgi:GNAT superfamily N-acetyltransferase
MARPSGWTTEALVGEVIASPWRVPSSNADTRDVQRPGWFQRLTPSLRQGGLNEVSHCVIPAEDADRVIDETIAGYHALGIRFRWAVTPGSKPDDLAERLAKRGFSSVELWGVVRDLSPLPAKPGTDVRVTAVDASSVDEFTDVMASGWSMDPEPLRPMHRAMVERPGGTLYRLFAARAGGAVAGVAAYTVSGPAAYQMGAVVLPSHRGRGLYQALVAARLSAAASEGLALATSQARAETAGPILVRLGFEVVCRFPVFTIPVPG